MEYPVILTISLIVLVLLLLVAAFWVAAVVLGATGAVIALTGLGGGIATAAAVSDKRTKSASLLFFIPMVIVGLSCVAAAVGFYVHTTFFIGPLFAFAGAAAVVLGILGIVRASGIAKKAVKVGLIVLLSLVVGTGVLLLAAVALAAFLL